MKYIISLISKLFKTLNLKANLGAWLLEVAQHQLVIAAVPATSGNSKFFLTLV